MSDARRAELVKAAAELNLPLLKGASIVGVFWGAFTAANPKLHQIFSRSVFHVSSMKPRTGMHSFIQICLLSIGMAIKVNNTNFLISKMTANSPDRGKTNGVIST